LLNDEIPKTYGVYYNGWDWSGEGGDEGIGIHHPEGDLKMVSTYTDELISSDYLGVNPNPEGKYWKVTWAETENGHGVTEGGSSGSPIFNEEGYVVGALSGGRASCSATDKPDFYGKFSYSWESNGNTPERQLKPWLDPINSGNEKLRGMYLDSSGILADFEANRTKIRVGGLVNFTNLSEGEIIGYKWIFEGGKPQESEIISPSYIQYEMTGDFDVTLIARSVKDADTIVKKDYIHVMPTITPNPSRGYFRITFGTDLPQELDVYVSDMQGRNVNYYYNINEGDNEIVIDLSRQASGVYIIMIMADGVKEVLKACVVRHTNF
jgi:PKD repeat protein